MQHYRTSDGDMLDWICWRCYGRTAAVVETVLEANPGLADLDPVYPAGVLIVLPEIAAAQPDNLIRLWD